MITVRRQDFKRVQVQDESPNLSDLGQYADTPGEGAIDRQVEAYARGEQLERGEYRYFNPTLTGEQTGNPDSPREDYQRMEAYERGEWCVWGIRASVTVKIPIGGTSAGGHIRHVVESPGLWGIESDSDESCFDEVFGEESDTLARMLRELGVKVVD